MNNQKTIYLRDVYERCDKIADENATRLDRLSQNISDLQKQFDLMRICGQKTQKSSQR